jgi:hypothetical protein
MPDAGDEARLVRDAAIVGARQAQIQKAVFDRFLQLGGDQATLAGGLFLDNEWVEGNLGGVLPLGVPPGLG